MGVAVNHNNGQQPLFYEDALDAIEKAIASSGKTKKEIAAIIYPGRQPETAKSLLSRALTSENTDVHLSMEMILTILKETRADDFIFFLCDEFGFERPIKKDKESFKKEVKGDLKNIMENLKHLTRKVEALENEK